MTFAELKRRLRHLGVQLDEQGTRHEIWLNERTGRRVPIPRHDHQEVGTGLLHRILDHLGIGRDEFDRG